MGVRKFVISTIEDDTNSSVVGIMLTADPPLDTKGSLASLLNSLCILTGHTIRNIGGTEKRIERGLKIAIDQIQSIARNIDVAPLKNDTYEGDVYEKMKQELRAGRND